MPGITARIPRTEISDKLAYSLNSSITGKPFVELYCAHRRHSLFVFGENVDLGGEVNIMVGDI